ATSSRNAARRFGAGDATLTPATESEARRRNENTANGMRDGCVAKADSFDALPASGLLECIFDALPLRCLSACMARREAPAAIPKGSRTLPDCAFRRATPFPRVKPEGRLTRERHL